MARLPDPARSRAVLIGTSEYTDPELPAIPGVANNLADLAAVLTAPRGTGLPDEHVVVLADPPDEAGVGDRIVQAAEEAEDVLLVYYSGHGLMTWDRTNELCLALRDTRSKAVRTSALRCADVRQYIMDSAAGTRVLILDCCFSGRGIEPTMADPAGVLLDEVDVAGAYVLAATQGRALAPVRARNTLFTGELLRLLNEGVAAEPGLLLTLDVLYRQVRSAMQRANLPVPCRNNADSAAQLALAHNAAHETHRQLAVLRAAVDRLVEAEAETARVHARTLDRIAAANLPPLTVAAPASRVRLAELESATANGKPPPGGELDELTGELKASLDATEELRKRAAGLLDRRDQLRARLAGYQVMAVSFGVAEDYAISVAHQVAWDLVWTKPCPLGAATQAVNAYQRAVIERREGRL